MTPSFWKAAGGKDPFSSSVFYLGALIVFAMLCLLRGWTPSYEAQLYFHITDLIGLASILADGSYPAETIFSQFAKTLNTFSLGLWGYRNLIELGVSPGTLYLATTYLQIAALAVGTSLIAYVFRPVLSHIALTSGVIFFGVFLLFGRYINLNDGFWVSYSSGHAVSIGLIVVGLLLNRFDRSAAVLAAAVALYHPSHGLVDIALVAVVQIWRLVGSEAERFRQAFSVALIAATLFVPIYVYYLVMIPPLDGSAAEWWTMTVAVQRVMTPLADGMPVVIGLVVAGLLTIVLLSCREFASLRGTAERARIMAALVLLFLLVQCFAEFAQLTRLAQLCLTRSQPYMAIISGAAVVAIARLWWEGSSSSAVGASADRVAAILVIGAALVPQLRLPSLIPPLVRIDFLYHQMVLEQWRCILVLTAALYWSFRRSAEVNRTALNSAYTFFVVGYALLLGLQVEVVSSATLLAITSTSYPLPRSALIPRALSVAFIIVAAFSLQKRQGWSTKNLTLLRGESNSVVREHVEKGAMVLVVPHGASDVIQLLPYYSEFLSKYEMHFTLYAPWLTSLALEKLSLQGINPTAYKEQCRESALRVSQCLHIRYGEEIRRRDDTWRKNLRLMTELSPRLTHVLILRSHMCKDDKPQEEPGQFALVRVDDVAPAGCT